MYRPGKFESRGDERSSWRGRRRWSCRCLEHPLELRECPSHHHHDPLKKEWENKKGKWISIQHTKNPHKGSENPRPNHKNTFRRLMAIFPLHFLSKQVCTKNWNPHCFTYTFAWFLEWARRSGPLGPAHCEALTKLFYFLTLSLP